MGLRRDQRHGFVEAPALDWSKVDAALAGALADADAAGSARLAVFVHVDVDRAEVSLLEELGVRASGGGVCTGTVSPDGVDRLTDQSWVSRVRLSAPLRLLDDA